MFEDLSRRSVLKSSLGVPLAGVALQYATDEVAAADGDATLPADEYAALRSRWADLLTGGSIDQTKAEYDDALATLDQDAQDYQNTIETNPTDRLWSDLPIPADSSSSYNEGHLTDSYSRLLTMAKAYQTEGSALEGDSSLASDIVTGLEFLYSHLYNENQSQFGNWWHWEIGTPMRLMGICTLLYSDLTSTQVTNYTNAVATHVGSPYEYTFYDHPSGGANRVDESIITAIRGLLTETDSTVALARDCVEDSDIFQYTAASSGNGLYPDGSYVYHKEIPYIGSYGAILFTGLSELFTILDGSSWEITGVDRDVIYDAVGDAISPFMFKGLMMGAVSGRSISREDQSDHVRGHNMTLTVLRMANAAPEPYATEFKELAKGWIENDTWDSFISDAEVADIANAEAVLEDGSITAASEPVESTVFHNMDRVVHNRSDWAFTISMCSDRIARYEAINEENLHGWHTGAGMTQLYNDDLGHYTDAYWPTVDPYRLPGTTVDTSERTDLDGTHHPLPSTQWVGGATVGEEFSMVGMEFEAEKAPLTGKKSWLALDDMIVALGSDITLVEENQIEDNPPGENPDATQIPSTADTFVRDGGSSGDNYSTWGLMVVKNDVEGYNRESFLKFDLSSLSESVEQATLHLHGFINTDGDASSGEVTVSRVTDDSWTGSELTWNTKPDIGSEVGTMTVSGTKQWYAIDVTEFIKSQASGDGTASFSFQQLGDGIRTEFDSPDGGQNAPQLSVVTSGDGETSMSDGPRVETIVENRNLHTNASEVLTVDDTTKSSTPDWSETIPDVSWAHLENFGGFHFPDEPTLNAVREERTGSWNDINVNGSTDQITREYQTLWFDHGTSPTDATYAYALFPGLTSSETQQRSQEPGYEIVANNDSVQAVTVPELGVTAANFWSSGSITIPGSDRTLTVSGPASVLLRWQGPETSIGVSDPSRTQDTLTVEFDHDMNAMKTDNDRITVTQIEPTIKMDVRVGGSRGATHTATFSAQPSEVAAEFDVDILDSSSEQNEDEMRLRASLGWFSQQPIHDTEMHLDLPEDWTISSVENEISDPLHRDEQATATWNIVPPTDVGTDSQELAAAATYRTKGSEQQIEETVTVDLTQELSPVADAFVRDGSHSATNYGDRSYLVVKSSAAAGYNRQTHLQFDLENLQGAVGQATLYLYGALTGGNSASSVECAVSGVGDDWTEDDLTWDTKPTLESDLGSLPVNRTRQWWSIDVTDYVKSEYAGNGAASFAVYQPETGPYVDFESTEAAEHSPYLHVTMSP